MQRHNVLMILSIDVGLQIAQTIFVRKNYNVLLRITIVCPKFVRWPSYQELDVLLAQIWHFKDKFELMYERNSIYLGS